MCHLYSWALRTCVGAPLAKTHSCYRCAKKIPLCQRSVRSPTAQRDKEIQSGTRRVARLPHHAKQQGRSRHPMARQTTSSRDVARVGALLMGCHLSWLRNLVFAKNPVSACTSALSGKLYWFSHVVAAEGSPVFQGRGARRRPPGPRVKTLGYLQSSLRDSHRFYSSITCLTLH